MKCAFMYVEAQMATGAYSNIDEYFLHLVQQDRKWKAEEKLEALLLEAINSEDQEVTPDYWQKLRDSVLGNKNTEIMGEA